MWAETLARNGRVQHLHQVSKFAQRREASENTATTPARLKHQNCFGTVAVPLSSYCTEAIDAGIWRERPTFAWTIWVSLLALPESNDSIMK
jgi:hypothetical protein